MNIVLSQRIDFESDYKDIPFQVYHFPKRYLSQIQSGDQFIYYQGDRHNQDHRYYFGRGIIGAIDEAEDGEHHYARILKGRSFPTKVPIYHPKSGYYESLGFREVRRSETPPWQQSIRKVSREAFHAIVTAAHADPISADEAIVAIETSTDPLEVLRRLNEQYAGYVPESRDKEIEQIIDRGTGVIRALKRLGGRCQICNWQGFRKRGGEEYIEAHHLSELAKKRPGALCSENVILVCPNCHRELHYGCTTRMAEEGEYIVITLANREARIQKNRLDRIETILRQRR